MATIGQILSSFVLKRSPLFVTRWATGGLSSFDDHSPANYISTSRSSVLIDDEAVAVDDDTATPLEMFLDILMFPTY